MWNTGLYPDLKWYILIQQIQIKEYIPENLAPKPKHQNPDKQKLAGKNCLQKGCVC